ncbi:uracil-DNA glycosylase [Halochromatium sp.]
MDESRRLHYLKAMGIQVWKPRVAGESAAPQAQTALAQDPPLPTLAQRPASGTDSHSGQGQDRKARPATTTTPVTATSAAGAQAALQAIARASAARKAQEGKAETAAGSSPAVGSTATQKTNTQQTATRSATAATSTVPPASQQAPAPSTPSRQAEPSQHPAPAPAPTAFSPSAAESNGPPPWLDEPPPWSDDEQPPWPTESDLPDIAQDRESGANSPALGLAADQHGIAKMNWGALEASVAECRRCKLCETRTQTVFGTGDHHAELLFIGEGPGQDEDRQGEPFVGRAGQLLNKMLAAVGLKREQVYIANIVKCRPPRNRNPAPDEASACRPYLERQIALIQPKLIVSLGAVSANNLLGNTEAVGRLRGKQHQFQLGAGAEPIPLLVTYHPSYYLRSPAEKAKGWQDLQRIIRFLKT